MVAGKETDMAIVIGHITLTIITILCSFMDQVTDLAISIMTIGIPIDLTTVIIKHIMVGH